MEKPYVYQLAESLHRSTPPPPPLSQQHSNRDSRTELINKRTSSPMTDASTPPPAPLVSPLPNNAVVFQSTRSPQESDSSFRNYIDQHFQQDATALKTHLANGETNSNQYTTSGGGFVDTEKQPIVDEPNTLWTVLKTDFDQFQGKDGSSWIHNDQQRQRQRPWWAWDDHDGIASAGAVLFMCGFIIPPLWWLGAFWPRRPDQGGKMAIRWQQLNRYFSIGFSIILLIVIIVIAVLYGTSH